MGVKDVLEKKAQQYGVNMLATDLLFRPESADWVVSKVVVGELPQNPDYAVTDWVDQYITKGIIEDNSVLDEKEKSKKTVKNTSDLKFWGVLKSDERRMSLVAPFKINGFDLELVVYFDKEGNQKRAFYALFGLGESYIRWLI